jgi:diguanylate cyclase (GGDEF)-like protein
VVAGLLVVICTDTAFAVLTLRGTYATGLLWDIGWPLGYMLVGLGAWHVRAGAAAPVAPSADAGPRDALCAPSLVQSLLPYVLMPPAIALLCFVYAYGGHDMRAWGVYAAFGLLAVLILARQFFVVWENQGLYLRVRDAYVALEQGTRSLQLANRRLERLATTDGMTDLPNHRAFQERLRSDLAAARRAGTPVALLMLDVDHFKQYNDTFGHPAGDDVLRRTGAMIRSVVRESDLPARYGGEEFAVVLPGADVRVAREIAERIRAAMAEHPWPHVGVTVSIGVACGTGAVEAGALIEAADRALYRSKSGGRDRVTVAEEVASVRTAA